MVNVFGFTVIIFTLAKCIYSAPVQVCVEESKHKTVGSSMIALSDVPTEDQRQCIVLCLKDRKTPCRSCVFSKSSCKLFSRTAKESGKSLKPDDDSNYYEILEDCPPNKTPISETGDKRRDLSLTDNNSAHQLAIKDMKDMAAKDPEGPPVQGGGSAAQQSGGGQYQIPAVGQYQGGPAPVPAPGPAQGPASYGPWTAWTQCPTVPCGYGSGGGGGGGGGAASAGGAQTRSRQCQGYGGCQGEANQQQPCGCQPPPQGQWTEWGPWASCSASCGGGQMSRSRSCTVPNTCQGQATDQQQCGQGPCAQWSPWTGYGGCSATCGSGTQARQRTCAGYGGVGSGSGCSGPPSEQMPCPSLPPCCSEWSAWSQCSCSCGPGTQTRKRNCGGGYSSGGGGSGEGNSGGSNTESQTCTGGPCVEWGNWSPWTSCSVTCSSGQRGRSRQCNSRQCGSDAIFVGTGCIGENQDSESCTAGPCAQWAEWGPWASCSQTCGSGQQSRSRQCTGGGNCVGDGQQSQNCESGPCPQWCPWQNWAQCSVTCGDGQQSRTRICGVGSNCASNTNAYSGGNSLSSFGTSSAGCGGENSQQQSCSTGACAYWSEWTDWNQCSASCGAGQISRSRQCSTGSGCPGEPQQSQPCQGPPCATWCAWQEWTTCSTTCSVGQHTRTRICSTDSSCTGSATSSSCAGESINSEQCNSGPCPAWADWEAWNTCSATCGEGQRVRARQCTSGTNCPGESRAVESCSPCATCPQWDVWTPWSSCQSGNERPTQTGYGAGAIAEGTTACGRGQQTRSRSCVGSCGGAGGCVGESIQNQPCFQQCAEWSPWTNWSICSSSCAAGQQTRSRQCSGTGCPGSGSDSQTCQMPVCPQVVQPHGSYYQPQYANFYQQRGTG